MSSPRRLIFLLFFLSGFCGLTYEVIWLRLAFATFGVITPVVSVVVSVFMGGLALGSWLGGRFIARLCERAGLSAIVLYGSSELVISVGSFAVPWLFRRGDRLLGGMGSSDSAGYLAASAIVITLSIVPWTALMGTTFPWMMAFIRERFGEERSFSYLYVANVVGAALGAWLTAFVLIETRGFTGTLRLAGQLNVLAALISFWIASRLGPRRPRAAEPGPAEPARSPSERLTIVTLFTTGFVSMGMEVAWTRAYAGILGNTVYAFATILTVYLIATMAGSLLYRRHQRAGRPVAVADVLGWMAAVSLLPVLLADPRFSLGVAGVSLGIAPLCALLGYLTPQLIDAHAADDPRKAGLAYGVNIVGCILGPLVTSYVLLASMVERLALVALALPLFFLALGRGVPVRSRRWSLAAGAALLVWSAGLARAYSEGWRSQRKVVRTDHTATVVSLGEGMGKQLLVNGVGMTKLTTITKMMVHLPLALRRDQPKSALVLCFGMGTTFRSALSWGMRTTAVELVPSVVEAFGFYHADAVDMARDPRGRIVVDDARRFLRRTSGRYDLIVLDPPPPIEAAGSGMLYSVEFYEQARAHLERRGVMQQWFPVARRTTFEAGLRSVQRVFPHVRVFLGVEGWGAHVLASMEPIPVLSVDQAVANLPPAAKADLVEWVPKGQADPVRSTLAAVLGSEVRLTPRGANSDAPEITDDRPLNEYDWLRRHGKPEPLVPFRQLPPGFRHPPPSKPRY